MFIILLKVFFLNCMICFEICEDCVVIYVFIEVVFCKVLYSSYIEQFIVDVLCLCGELSFLLVVEKDGQVVGYVVLLLVMISDGSIGWFGLGLILVLFEWQGQGIGVVLMYVVFDVLCEQGVQGCVLLGELVYYG